MGVKHMLVVTVMYAFDKKGTMMVRVSLSCITKRLSN